MGQQQGKTRNQRDPETADPGLMNQAAQLITHEELITETLRSLETKT
tara:strand:- start:652 stop:792 length:141 start_codon:yes stop_codon:yes gene_type:complete